MSVRALAALLVLNPYTTCLTSEKCQTNKRVP